MNQRTLTGLGITAAALAAVALALESGRDAAAAWRKADEPLFPALADRADDVTTFVVESADGVTTLERDGDEWTVAERGGYRGRGEEVGRLLFALADARRLEPKTERPERYEKLGLGGFEEEGSPTTRVTVKAGDAALADLFVGRRRFVGAGESWYVREPDEATTWAVEAKLRTPRSTAEWLETELFDVPRERISEVEVLHADGDRVHLVRSDPDASFFDLENLPEGREPASERSGAAFLNALASLRLTDVHPASEVEIGDPAPITTTFWTKDGLRVTARMKEDGDQLLATLEAAFDETRAPGGEMGPPLPAEEPDEEAAEGEDEPPAPVSVPGEEDEDEPKTREEVEAEVAEIDAQTAGWVFVLPSWKKTSFVTTLEELLKDLPEEEDDAEAPGEGDGTPPPPPAAAQGADDDAAGGGDEADTSGGDEQGGDAGDGGATPPPGDPQKTGGSGGDEGGGGN